MRHDAAGYDTPTPNDLAAAPPSQTLRQQIDIVRAELGVESSRMHEVISEANRLLGLRGTGPFPDQVTEIMAALGI